MSRQSLIVFVACVCLLLTGQPARAQADLKTIVVKHLTTSRDFTLKVAEQMPEADYAFKPVATVRSFGQLIGHVAGSQNAMCAMALGDPEKSEDEIEKSATTKAQLVAALRASSEYCRRAYAQTGTAAAADATVYGEKQSRIAALALNAVHDAEHYGNVVTYLRIKGMVPPSSQPRP